MKFPIVLAVLLFFGCSILVGNQQKISLTTFRGWLSDEQCARSRASAGKYTGTNPECAKRCVREGRRVVLILADKQEIVVVANGDVARENIGDYVEVRGQILPKDKTLQISDLKLIEKGYAQCEAPRKKTTAEN